MLDPNEYDAKYVGPFVNMSQIHQIQRGNYTMDFGYLGYSLYEPPPLELYTIFSKQTYFLFFLGLHFLQILVIFTLKTFWLKRTYGLSIWETFLCSVEQSHFPFPSEDWDARNGGCLDHIERKKRVQNEFLTITIINLLFNLVLLFPLVILCKIFCFIQ